MAAAAAAVVLAVRPLSVPAACKTARPTVRQSGTGARAVPQRLRRPASGALLASGRRRRGRQHQTGVSAATSASSAWSDDYYGTLGVQRAADKAELKAAFRRLALQWHPDVSNAPAAEERFKEISNAYEVLYDEDKRRLYDQFGVAGIDKSQVAGRTAADEAWDEFKPYVRKNRKTTARDAAAGSGNEDADAADDSLPKAGDVVEYKLSELAQRKHNDGRLRGVAFLVGRNMDRGDRDKLPPENLDLCELEPLWQSEDDDGLWSVDPLENAAFARLTDLRVVPSRYNRSTDTWELLDELSESCGGPTYAEEVIV
eukprot:jgi/Chlat1/7506/Chrsp61S07006